MALGIVSDKEWEDDIRNSVPSGMGSNRRNIDAVIVEEQKPGRKEGQENTPEILRKLIGEEYAIEGREDGLELAKEFGISPSSASAYANGANSTASYNEPNPTLKSFINNRKQKIAKRAGTKVLRAIEEITDAKLAEAPAGVLANIAKSLSGVIKDMEPEQNKEGNSNNIQFIMYAPRLMKEENFDVIQVSE